VGGAKLRHIQQIFYFMRIIRDYKCKQMMCLE